MRDVFVALIVAAFSAGSSWAQSHPSPETIMLFDKDFIGYPALTAERIQVALDVWNKLLEERKQKLQEAEVLGYEKLAEHYRVDIAYIEQRIGELEGAGPTVGELMSSPEAQAKLAQAKQAATAALETAKHGQYSDAKPITGLLVFALGAARQIALAGMEEQAAELEGQAKETIKVFSDAFADNCKGQSFDPLFVRGLNRQNELAGNSNDRLQACEFRLLATVSGSGGWRHCGIGIGDWSYRDNFFVDRSKAFGTGMISVDDGTNKFSFRVTGPNADFKIEGRLELQRKEFRAPEGRVLGVMMRLLEHRESASGHFGAPGAPEVTVNTFGREREWDVTTLNDNMPCDTSEDVWSY